MLSKSSSRAEHDVSTVRRNHVSVTSSWWILSFSVLGLCIWIGYLYWVYQELVSFISNNILVPLS